jgi:hypothetical protein
MIASRWWSQAGIAKSHDQAPEGESREPDQPGSQLNCAVIVSLHVATGAAAGAASGSRVAALLLGPVLHLAGDRLPHQDIRSRHFEIGSGLAGLVLLAAGRGPLDPATLGAAASSAPDLEHVLPFLRPGGRKLFHGRRGWHRSGRFPADLQLLLAGAILGVLIAPRNRAV